jgi:hypothetical protein
MEAYFHTVRFEECLKKLTVETIFASVHIVEMMTDELIIHLGMCVKLKHLYNMYFTSTAAGPLQPVLRHMLSTEHGFLLSRYNGGLLRSLR